MSGGIHQRPLRRPLGDRVHRRPVLVAGGRVEPVLVEHELRDHLWHAKSGPRVEARAPVPEYEFTRRPRQVSELRKGGSRLPQDRPLSVAEHSLPGLLRIEAIRARELDRLLQVVVVDVQELQCRPLLAQQVQQRHGPGSRDALLRERDLAKLPHATPGVGVDAVAERREVLALEGGTLLRRQQIADVGTHRVGDPEARQKLEVDAHAQQPSRFGEVPLLVDDVGDEGARVQRRLVHPDEQDREPRVVRVPGARDADGGGLARDVGAHDSLEDAAVQRAEAPHVGDIEHRLGRRDCLSAVEQAQFDAELLQEQVAEPVRIVVLAATGIEVCFRVEGEHQACVRRPRRAERPLATRVEALQLDRPPVPPWQLDRVRGSVVPGQRQRHVDRHSVAPLRKRVEDMRTVRDVFVAEHQRRVVTRAEAGMARVVGWTASTHEGQDLDRSSPLRAQVGADPVEDLRVARSVPRRVGDRRVDLRSRLGRKQRAPARRGQRRTLQASPRSRSCRSSPPSAHKGARSG